MNTNNGHPIIFSDSSVRAILAGLKTQTRRVIKARINESPNDWARAIELCDGSWSFWYPDRVGLENFAREVAYPSGGGVRCPYGTSGSSLWVKEAWMGSWSGRAGGDCNYTIRYRADGVSSLIRMTRLDGYDNWDRWQSPIFMPRRFSRIMLEIEDVRVERVQDITRADCVAEGMGRYAAAYAAIWDVFNAKRGYGWNKNPWVWVITFKKWFEIKE